MIERDRKRIDWITASLGMECVYGWSWVGAVGRAYITWELYIDETTPPLLGGREATMVFFRPPEAALPPKAARPTGARRRRLRTLSD